MARTVDDAVLGRLERRRGRWRGEVVVAGAKVPLAVVGARGGPDEASLALARRAGDELAKVRADLERALAEHREPWGPTAEGWTIEWASVAPVDGAPALELGLATDWDEEHTLGARIRAGRLLELNGSVLRP